MAMTIAGGFHDCNPKPLCLSLLPDSSQGISPSHSSNGSWGLYNSNGSSGSINSNLAIEGFESKSAFGTNLLESFNNLESASGSILPPSSASSSKSYNLASSSMPIIRSDIMSQKFAFVIQPTLSTYKNNALLANIAAGSNSDWPLILGTLSSNTVQPQYVFGSNGIGLTMVNYPDRVLTIHSGTGTGNATASIRSSVSQDMIFRLAPSSDSTYYNIFINSRTFSNSLYNYLGSLCINQSNGQVYMSSDSTSSGCRWTVKSLG